MHWSKLFIPTLRDDHPLLERAGYIRQLSPGVSGHLFLAQRSLLKITAIVREEMHAIGAQEFHLPGPMIEKTMAAVAHGLLRSYKQLPQIWFTTEGSCSFDRDAAGLEAACEKHRAAYRRILNRCGLEHAAITEARDPEGDLEPEQFPTPNVKTIAEVARFTGLPETSHIKSLVMVADGKPVLALLRGDHQLSEAKLSTVLGATQIRAAHPEELQQWFGADAGSLGPIGVPGNVRIVADEALRRRRNLIAGANKNDHHMRHVTPEEDFATEFHDLRRAAEGDTPELAHIFKLGTRYSKSADLHVTNESGQEIAPLMGSYGVGIERILSAAVDLYHDADGIALPAAIAPFTVVVTPVNVKDDAQRSAAQQIYDACQCAGLDALLDDRDERPGVKFKDADLIGVPCRITVGKKLPQGIVELAERRPKRSADVRIEQVVDAVRDWETPQP